MLALFGPLTPQRAEAQFADPCATACALTLGAVGAVAATGAAVALGRLEGGMSTSSQGLWTWGMSYALVVGSGIALSGDGERQERAVYAAAVGSAAGALAGLAIASMGGSSDGTRRLAGTLIGAAAGAIVGGVYGAVSQDETGTIATGLSLSLSF